MQRLTTGAVVLIGTVMLGVVAAAATLRPDASTSATLQESDGSSGKGWTIPTGGSKEPNPIELSPEVLEKGKKVYENSCQKCHGKEGKGDGPDADPDMPPEDLTDPERAVRNPDGTMFYKIWNGRKSPKMPAFKSEGLTKDEVWQVIHFVKTFRKS
jgi:mono/diheme cytochrome c family protein